MKQEKGCGYSASLDLDRRTKMTKTAKEILQKIYDEVDYYSCQPAIEQLAKEYGAEIQK